MYSEEEEMQLLNMQRSWHQGRRSSSAFSLLGCEEEVFFEKTLRRVASTVNCIQKNIPNHASSSITHECAESGDCSANNLDEIAKTVILDASKLGDIPARYVISQLAPHQMPVAGVYVDPRILPGFKYSVLPLNSASKKKYLFGGEGLLLKSVGRGYARRFTFVDDGFSASSREHFFWSDNNLEGYGFEIRAVSVGDKFTVYDANHEPHGHLEVIKINEKQIEIEGSETKHGFEKKVRVKMIASVELYDGISQNIPVTGVAIYLKKHNEKYARVTKILNVNLNHHRYYLVPGVEKSLRRITLNGNDINDVPTKYTIKGIELHELPVIGTYVDPRIYSGFSYKVRPANSKRYLFKGEPLNLISIGQGYAKRFTFESNSKLNGNNFFWSDNNLEGFAFETRAVYNKMKFSITTDGQVIGEAKVFRCDLPQIEHSTKKVLGKNGEISVVKHVHVDLLCQVKLDTKNSGASDESLMRIHGLAVLSKNSNDKIAKLEKIENVALDSQINLLFARANANLTFIPTH